MANSHHGAFAAGQKGFRREQGGNWFQHREGRGGGRACKNQWKLLTIKRERKMQGNMPASLQSWGNQHSSFALRVFFFAYPTDKRLRERVSTSAQRTGAGVMLQWWTAQHTDLRLLRSLFLSAHKSLNTHTRSRTHTHLHCLQLSSRT